MNFQDSFKALLLMASSSMGVPCGLWDQAHVPQRRQGDSEQMGGGAGLNFLVTLQRVWLLQGCVGLLFASARSAPSQHSPAALGSVHASRSRWDGGS